MKKRQRAFAGGRQGSRAGRCAPCAARGRARETTLNIEDRGAFMFVYGVGESLPAGNLRTFRLWTEVQPVSKGAV